MNTKQKFLNKFNEMLVEKIKKLERDGDLDLELIVHGRLSEKNIAIDAEFSSVVSPSTPNHCDVLSMKFCDGKTHNFITDYHLNGDYELSFSKFETGTIEKDFYLDEYGDNEVLILDNKNSIDCLNKFFFDFNFLKLTTFGDEPTYESEQEKLDMEELMRLASEFKKIEDERMSKAFLENNPTLFKGSESLKLRNAHKHFSNLVVSPITTEVASINSVLYKEYLIDLNDKIDKIKAVYPTDIKEELKSLEEKITLRINEISQNIEGFKDVVFSDEMYCEYIYEENTLLTSPNFIFPATYQNIDVKINVFGRFYQARNFTSNDFNFRPISCCIGEADKDFYYDEDGVYIDCLYEEEYGLLTTQPLLEKVHDNTLKVDVEIGRDFELIILMNEYLRLSNALEDAKYNADFFKKNPDFKQVIEGFQNVNFVPRIIHLKNGHSYYDYSFESL